MKNYYGRNNERNLFYKKPTLTFCSQFSTLWLFFSSLNDYRRSSNSVENLKQVPFTLQNYNFFLNFANLFPLNKKNMGNKPVTHT